MQYVYLKALVGYAVKCGLMEKEDEIYAINSLLDVLELQEYAKPEFVPEMELKEILEGLITYAVDKGIISDSIVEAVAQPPECHIAPDACVFHSDDIVNHI